MKKLIQLLTLLAVSFGSAAAASIYNVSIADPTPLNSTLIAFQFAGFADPASARIYNFVGGDITVSDLSPSGTQDAPGDYRFEKNNDGDTLLLIASNITGPIQFVLSFSGGITPEPINGDWNVFLIGTFDVVNNAPVTSQIDFLDPVEINNIAPEVLIVSPAADNAIPEPSTALLTLGAAAAFWIARTKR